MRKILIFFITSIFIFVNMGYSLQDTAYTKINLRVPMDARDKRLGATMEAVGQDDISGGTALIRSSLSQVTLIRFPVISRMLHSLREALISERNQGKLEFNDVPDLWEEIIAKNFDFEKVVQAMQEWSEMRGGEETFYLGFGDLFQGFPDLFFDMALRGAIKKITRGKVECKSRMKVLIRNPNENKDVREFVARPFIPLAIDQDISDLIFILENPAIFSPLVRKEAARKLADLASYKEAKAAIPALIQTFLSDFSSVRGFIVEETGVLQNEGYESLRALMLINPEASIEFRGQSMSVGEVTILLLSSPNITTRRNAVNVIATTNYLQAVPVLLKLACEEPDAEFREHVLECLTRSRMPAQLQFLMLTGEWRRVAVAEFTQLVIDKKLTWHSGYWHESLDPEEIIGQCLNLETKKNWLELDQLFWKVSSAAEVMLHQTRVDMGYVPRLVGCCEAITSVLKRGGYADINGKREERFKKIEGLSYARYDEQPATNPNIVSNLAQITRTCQ